MAKKRKKNKTNYLSVTFWALLYIGACCYWRYYYGSSVIGSLLLGFGCLIVVVLSVVAVMGTIWNFQRERSTARSRSHTAADVSDADTGFGADALHPQGQWWDSVAGRWIDVVDEASMRAPMSQRWNDDYGRWEDIPEEDEWAMTHLVGQEWNDLTGRWEDAGR